MKSAIYSRYSSDAQRATSLEDQARNCRRRAEAEGWPIIEMFADAAISGADSSRPQYQRMLAAAAAREFEVLLVDDLSRFARDSVEQERAIRRLEFQGVRIIAVSDGYDSESKARKIHRGMKGLMNEVFLDDLREKVHRGQEGQALKGYWNGGKPFGYRLRPVLDPTRLDPYGQPVRIGTVLEVDPEQGPLVKQMFERFAEGASALTIAKELNEWNIPSPGATWRRKVRRCRGWMSSGVRVILRNPLYTGRQHWNTTRYDRDPDSGKDRCRPRPESEWLVHQDERLRIVSDALFDRVKARTRIAGRSDERLKSGGKVKYLLSGLLTCASCGAKYVMADRTHYGCSGYWNGRACSNATRIRRDVLEGKLLDPTNAEAPIGGLLAPQRVARMAAEMERLYLERLRQNIARSENRPRELEELAARIERLRERRRQGDPDMTADELEAAIDRAEGKLRELEAQMPAAKASAKVLSILPRAAELYRRQVALGLDGNPREALRARMVLRSLVVDGRIMLRPGENGSLWAKFSMAPEMLLKATGTGHRGEAVCAVPAIPVEMRVK